MTMRTSKSITDGELAHPLLAGYDLEERKAILVHKYYLGLEMHADPGVGRAIRSWEARHALLWRRRRQLGECQEQMHEIEAHRAGMCQRLGESVSWEAAAHDWITRHAAEWRSRHSQPAGGQG